MPRDLWAQMPISMWQILTFSSDFLRVGFDWSSSSFSEQASQAKVAGQFIERPLLLEVRLPQYQFSFKMRRYKTFMFKLRGNESQILKKANLLFRLSVKIDGGCPLVESLLLLIATVLLIRVIL